MMNNVKQLKRLALEADLAALEHKVKLLEYTIVVRRARFDLEDGQLSKDKYKELVGHLRQLETDQNCLYQRARMVWQRHRDAWFKAQGVVSDDPSL